MTLRLGRMLLDASNVKVQKASFGDGLSLGLRAHSTQADHGWGVLTLRDQVQGMQGQLVALAWSGDKTWDGFYRLARVTSEIVRAAPKDRLAVVDFAVDLEPAGDGPVDFESTLVGATMTNAHGLSGGAQWLATPVGVEDLFSDPLPSRANRNSVDGLLYAWHNAASHSVWAADPAGFYGGAVTVRQNLAVVTGRGVVDPPGIFELNNGLCRVRWIVGEADWGSLDGTWDDMEDLTWDDLGGISGVEVATWHGATWVPRVWNLGITPTHVSVLRNDPHVCSVRLTQALSPGRRTLDLTLRRGSRTAHGYMRAPTGTRTVLRGTAEAGTVVTGGVRSTDPVDGVWYVVAATQEHDADTVQGGLTRVGDRLTFMVGGSVQDNVAGEINRWVSHTDESVRPVRR